MSLLWLILRYRLPTRMPDNKREMNGKTWLRKITITDRSGKRVSLLAPDCVLLPGVGLGREILEAFSARQCNPQVVTGPQFNPPLRVVQEMMVADRLFALLVEDSGRQPGTLVFDREGWPSGVTALLVQPPDPEACTLEFDATTNLTLAERIAEEMYEGGC